MSYIIERAGEILCRRSNPPGIYWARHWQSDLEELIVLPTREGAEAMAATVGGTVRETGS